MSLLHSLTTYVWDTKVAITFAAFSQLYGEFGRLVHQYTTNPLAKSVAIIMELPEIMTCQDVLKQKFDAIHDLIDKMLDVTKCIIEFRDVQSSHNQHVITQGLKMLINTAHISTAAYWTMRAAVMCAAMILNLIAIGREQISSTLEAWEISSLAHKLANILDHLRKVLNFCHQKIGTWSSAEYEYSSSGQSAVQLESCLRQKVGEAAEYSTNQKRRGCVFIG
ncbi:hypothetical protein MTR67_017626 [Solanum verrucosum]|uniref:Sieve element occlusion N-terminal domain-containing protein n=1 Tax=Solanum verrucosum TaxID=315347 RepID=A0AAF0QJ57_SOLVR|nr:hypothetical protein MTR67_017626 [Solanum verrucosum]